MNDRFLFRAFYEGRFIYKNLIDANYYTYDNKCIGLANTLPNSLIWEQCTGGDEKYVPGYFRTLQETGRLWR